MLPRLHPSLSLLAQLKGGIILVLQLLIHFQVAGQPHLRNFNHLSLSDQFSLIAVTSVAQDSLGFMWFATRDGLFRYDGAEFKRITSIYANPGRSSQNDLRTILYDSQGLFWLGTAGGLLLYDPVTDAPVPFLGKLDSSASYASNRIHCLKELASGNVLIGTRDGLYRYERAPQTVALLDLTFGVGETHASSNINCIYQTRIGDVWIGTQNGLFHGKGTNGLHQSLEVFRHDPSDEGSIVNDQIHALTEDRDGNLWIGTRQGLEVLKKGEKSFTHASGPTGIQLTHDFVRALTTDDDERLWVGTYDGITVIDTTGRVTQIKHDRSNPKSLSDNKVRSLHTDRNGNVWVGTYYGGVNYWNETNFKFDHIDDSYQDGLRYNVVSCIEQDQAGTLYFGTEGGGISVYRPQADHLDYLRTIGSELIGTVKTLYVDQEKLWVGTYNQGLICFDPQNDTYKSYAHNPEDSNSLANNTVLSIVRNNPQEYWIGMLGGGLNLFDPIKGTFRHFAAASDDPYSISSNSVRSLKFDASGNLWVGTQQGLCVLDKASLANNSFKFTRIGIREGMNPRVYVSDLYEDAYGTLWVATMGQSLLKVVDNHLVPVKIDGVASVQAIVEGSRDDLWLSTDAGIVQYNTATGASKTYDQRDGVVPNEFSRAAGLYASDSNVYIGGASGVTVFDPTDLAVKAPYVSEVTITEFQVQGKALEAGDTTGILEKSIEYTSDLTLKYNQNIFTITFISPDYVRFKEGTYQYRLLGLNDEWITTSGTSVSYTIQRGGTYTFEVRRAAPDGSPTNTITRLAIRVLPAPWRTWWAFTIYGLFIAGLLFGLMSIVQSRTRMKHQLELEKRELENQQKVNDQKLQFFTNVSHEFRTPLTLILGPLQRIIENYKGSRTVYRQLLTMQKNGDQLFGLINELMDFRKLENKQMKLSVSQANVVDFLKEVYFSFKPQAELHQCTYTFTTESEVVDAYFDSDKLERVFYNLLSNAFKYTKPGGHISLSITHDNQEVKVSVSDTGIGMQKDHLGKIFERFYEIPGHQEYGRYIRGTGIGLTIAKNIVDLHQGDISVVSEPNVGSTFTVTLPLGDSHLSKTTAEVRQETAEKRRSPVSEVNPSIDYTIKDPELLENPSEGDQYANTILVVEDNQGMNDFLRSILCKHYRVVQAKNGEEGLLKAREEQPDMIISDVMMPKMDGIAFCSKVKTDIRTSHIPFIVLTARTSLVYKYNGLESGADEYLNKPFNTKELLWKCHNILRTRDCFREKFLQTTSFTPSEMLVTSLDEDLMKKAWQIIEDNISNELFSVPDFSEQLGVSRTVLFAKVKAWTKKTPNELILSVRMKKAATLCEQKKHRTSQIAYSVGFKDPKYFAKCFKKYHGLSPKEYTERFAEV